jgi:hypothetical protein
MVVSVHGLERRRAVVVIGSDVALQQRGRHWYMGSKPRWLRMGESSGVLLLLLQVGGDGRR